MEKIKKKRILTRKLLIFKSAREQMLTTPNGHSFPDHHWVHSNCSLKVLRSGHKEKTQWENSLCETFHITNQTGTTGRNKVLDLVRVILGLKNCQSGINLIIAHSFFKVPQVTIYFSKMHTILLFQTLNTYTGSSFAY